MVIQHNLQAMNADRMLRINTNANASSTEKLSSGYKINRAADNAAGLAISEKMRKQIRGLSQAATNAEDGISCVQTSEGALAEIQDMLQRMNELCVQAANGTNSMTDRRYIQDEIDELITEIDRVSETTKFNELYLLKGDANAGMHNVYTTNYSVSYTRSMLSATPKNPDPLEYKVNYIGQNNLYVTSTSIYSANRNNPISADKIQHGKDLTEYMSKSTDDDNKMNAGFNTDSYVAFVNVALNSNVQEGRNGVVHGELPTTSKEDALKYDLSTSGADDKVRANRTLYIYDTKTDTVTRLQAGEEMADYLTDDNTMQDRYRLVDVLDGKKDTAKMLFTDPTQNLYAVDAAGTVSYSMVKNQQEVPAGNTYYKETGTTVADSITVTTTTVNNGGTIETQQHYTTNGKILFVDNNTIYELDMDEGPNVGTGANNVTAKAIHGTGSDFTTTAADWCSIVFGVVEAANLKDTDSGTSERVKEAFGLSKAENFRWDDSVVKGDESRQVLYDADGNPVSGVALNQYFDENGNYTGGLFSTDQARVEDVIDAEKIKAYISQVAKKIPNDLSFNVHAGSDSDLENKIEISIASIAAAGIGIDKLHSSKIGIVDETGANATSAVDVVGAALNVVSRQRSSLGAVQNRLEHTIKNLDNVVENTTSAEAQIRDTDMAEEMVAYSNNSILLQAGQSMLAQANQSNQGVLTLLQ